MNDIRQVAARASKRRLAVIQLICLTIFAASCGGGGGGSDSSGGNLGAKGDTSWLVRWNRIAIDASGRDHSQGGGREQLGPVRSARAIAIWAIATGDVAAAVSSEFQPFIPIAAAPNANLQAAIAQAGHDTLINIFKKQVPIFDAALAEDLASIPDGPEKDAGVALGKQTAVNAIAFCQNDGSEKTEPFVAPTYQPSQEAGFWRKDPLNPNQGIVGSTWSTVRPFVLESSNQFRLPPPPDMTSEEYATAYNDVKRIGGDGVVTPTERTLEQTSSAIFWAYDGTPSLCAPPRLYNQITVQIGLEQGLDVFQLSRLVSLVNVAMMDAGSASWDSKYYYNFWRPITGIRESDPGTGPKGAGDNNASTQGDTNWTPLGAPASNLSGKDFTPPFPSYPSGHATFGGALFQTMRLFFGTDDIPFTFVSDEFDGNTRDAFGNVRPLLPRSFRNLSEAEEENGQSRIYLGIHWEFDKTGGISQGEKVAQYVFDRIYRPTK